MPSKWQLVSLKKTRELVNLGKIEGKSDILTKNNNEFYWRMNQQKVHRYMKKKKNTDINIETGRRKMTLKML